MAILQQAARLSSDIVKLGYTDYAPQLPRGQATLHKLRASAPTCQSYGVAVRLGRLEIVKATLQQATRLSSHVVKLHYTNYAPLPP